MLRNADVADPCKEFIQIVISAMSCVPRQREVNIEALVFQFSGQNDGAGEGGISKHIIQTKRGMHIVLE